MQNQKSLLKKTIRFIIAIILLIFINSIDFGIKTQYFNLDIENFETKVEVYKMYFTGFFVFVSFLYLILENRNETESKDTNIISPEFLKHTPLIILIAIIIYTNFDKTVTNCSLIINKQKSVNLIEREFKIYSYDNKKEELRLIKNQLEFYEMPKNIYEKLENKKNIKLEFKIGLLGIPFDPKLKK